MIDFQSLLCHTSTIDRINISRAVQRGIDTCFKKLELNPKKTTVKLDGLLKAPHVFLNQETIIKGDAKEKVIGLASILAKVTRDAYMVRIARNYTQYGLEVHKGYGTKRHRDAILKYGLSKDASKSFCKSLMVDLRSRH